MENKNLIPRYLYFFLGIAINSFGVAFITKSALGTSQISSVPYVISLKYTNFTFGTATFIMNMFFILFQVVLLRRDFKPVQFLQIVVNVFFSWFIDVSMGILSFFNPAMLVTRFLSLMVGCLILAFGIAIEVAPNVVVVPGEGVVSSISKVTGVKFGTIKVYFDVLLIIIASALSFMFFGRLNGVGIGTIMSALTVGRFVNIINHRLPLIGRIRGLWFVHKDFTLDGHTHKEEA